MTINAAILILTQNTIERKVYLKTSLYFLFKNFNHIYKYPIIILLQWQAYSFLSLKSCRICARLLLYICLREVKFN